MPPALLEEVFELNEELDEIREPRESGGDPAALRERLEAARKPIERKREEHEREVEALSARWDQQATATSRGEARDARGAARAPARAQLHQQPAGHHRSRGGQSSLGTVDARPERAEPG